MLWMAAHYNLCNMHSSDRAFAELVRQVSLAPSREWISNYLDLIKTVVKIADLLPDDSRMSFTMPEAKQRFQAIRVNINNRWVLVNFTRSMVNMLGVIYGPEYEYQPFLCAYIERKFWFDPLRQERSTGYRVPQVSPARRLQSSRGR